MNQRPFGPQPERRPGRASGGQLGPPTRRAADLAPPRRARCDLQELTFSKCRPNSPAAPGPGFGELPECLACVLMALSAASERLVRLIELRAQLRDGCAQDFELGALLVAQFDAPIPSLIGLSHRPVFAVRRRPPARRAGPDVRVPAGHRQRDRHPGRRPARPGRPGPPPLTPREGRVSQAAVPASSTM